MESKNCEQGVNVDSSPCFLQFTPKEMRGLFQEAPNKGLEELPPLWTEGRGNLELSGDVGGTTVLGPSGLLLLLVPLPSLSQGRDAVPQPHRVDGHLQVTWDGVVLRCWRQGAPGLLGVSEASTNPRPWAGLVRPSGARGLRPQNDAPGSS